MLVQFLLIFVCGIINLTQIEGDWIIVKHTLSEKKVLKKLNIPDFRHVTKDKIVEFSSMLYRMDPEVAKKALEQIPEYVKMASEMVRTYKEIIDKMFQANATDTKAFYDACNGILATLAVQLQDTNITPEERNSINDRMISVAQMIGEKGAENKRYWIKVLGDVGKLMFGIVVVVASIAGVKGIDDKIK